MTEDSKDTRDESAAPSGPASHPDAQRPAQPQSDPRPASSAPTPQQSYPGQPQQDPYVPQSPWAPTPPPNSPQGPGVVQDSGVSYGPNPSYGPQGPNAEHAVYGMGDQQTAPLPPYPPGQGVGYPAASAGYPGTPGRRGRAGLVAGAVALALVSGGVGGAVGALVSGSDDGGSSTSINALNAPSPKSGQPAANAPAGTVPAVAQKVVPSVVMIQVVGARAQGEGSGVVLSSDGMILTNNHVASGAGPNAKIEVQFSDGSVAGATVVGLDPVSDLAVIKADKTGLTPIELGSSQNLQVGQSVVAVGSPLGLAGTVTTGIVSALNRPVSASGEGGAEPASVISAIQTDAPINPGNSGGALVDMNGNLIGINTAIATLGSSELTGQQSGSIGLGFAIPVDQARRVADQLIKTGRATYAQVGITVSRADDMNGARVQDVTPDGPAAKAGIPPGTVVTRVDSQVIDSGNALVAAIRSHQPGDKVKITYTDDKGQNPKTAEVTLAAAPAEGGR
ncbi:S1C family serine protease [Nocardia wallacei]|uniref:S1C family serine protease n=1 Tax=Nocardia wallacei TaxID=480035 RepID=UPI0024543C32|nr:trypsin-like peptidase domain-containing protein [Nocardia wallacei]